MCLILRSASREPRLNAGAVRTGPRPGPASSSIGRAGKERADVEHAEADERALRQQIESLEAELAAEV
ncbi:MAG: hypothetical protein VKI83_12375, partial [Synechococcaceae cyanobacterium]|nr:hypothetical protein [Synechococcaceae cyanobacterium]